MTGGRCHRRKKMMGRGPDGGCGIGERSCCPISRVPASNSLMKESERPQPKVKKSNPLKVDFFSQAHKVLSVRSPFDAAENASGSGVSSFPSASTLPSRLASLLRQSNGSRKRHKRSHSGADKKSSSRASDGSKRGNIWVETEDYFRELTLPDIDDLFELSSLFNSLGYSKCFYIPYIGNEKTERIETIVTNVKTGENVNGKFEESETNEQTDTRANVENANGNFEMDCMGGNGNGNGNGNGLVLKDEVNQEDEQLMEIDVGTQSDGAVCLPQEKAKTCSVSDLSSSVEWLLGCRNRDILTSEKPSKKRKLLGSDAGLEKVLVGCPCEGNLSLCDFCCKSEMGNDSNRLMVCSSCKVAVHLKCYGVQGDVSESWLCSWCKQKSDGNDLAKQSCVLCPKQGGALKPVDVDNGKSVLDFVHLFCSQWMPEVYIEDLAKMEPIMNVSGIKETRRKLVCNVCKVKCGTCVRCSHGTCRTAFHPICAREARHRMEVWGKYGTDNVELRAFCSKHTELPNDRDTHQLGEAFVSASHDCSVASHNPSTLQMDKQRLFDSRSNAEPLSEYGDLDKLIDMGIFERGGNEGAWTAFVCSSDNVSGGSLSEKIKPVHAAIPEKSNSINTDGGVPLYSDVNVVIPNFIKPEEYSNFYVHSCVHEKLSQIQIGMLLQKGISELEGSKDREISHLGASSNPSVFCNHQNKHSRCNDLICNSSEVNLEQLAKAKKLGILKLSPVDEVEGEIIYFQKRLLGNAVARKHFTDNLISKVARHLPQEIDAARGKRWDEVLVSQYLCDVREAKKRGRKERRHKEAQAVLAAATAAAAASSRSSSFRKDAFDESACQEKYNTASVMAGISSLLMPRPKEMLSRVAIPRISLEKYSDFVQSVSGFSKDHPRSCDICRRFETILNHILVCSGCKVEVHLDCYRCGKESNGPWHCELCEELLSSRCSGAPVNFWDRANSAECGLCGGITGAFRKSTDGRWVHAFCAEWVFEPTFRRGQVNPVEGMETIAKEINICCVCHHRHGVCIKCSAGHCQTTFHPTCARSAGFYMNVKTLNGKMQHMAYCEKHSLEQKAKTGTQKHGEEEIKSMRQVRESSCVYRKFIANTLFLFAFGQLERLRLLCERIVRREKIKRELVLCSHNILACKRDQVARSMLVSSPFSPTDVSSESATTSLKGNTDGYKSCGDAVQRSDDVTVDSTLSVKHRIKVTLTMDSDQKTDDSSTSQNHFTRKPSERMPFAGKQIPQRPSASYNILEEGEWSSKSKHYETFEKELVMTSDEASMKNQKLPKGYFYIPVDCLPKEKQINQDACSGEPLEHDR
ncbi:hypothetical protein H0E87_010837 [Populus deltoides]|uniref:PHD finger family protein n=1 Tax=Populus deltoides TaxID=3696 RepID=A0A8T2YV07_POPDE|nr:hypothetical protein H0E87_010837 [Populus deltoides]